MTYLQRFRISHRSEEILENDPWFRKVRVRRDRLLKDDQPLIVAHVDAGGLPEVEVCAAEVACLCFDR